MSVLFLNSEVDNFIIISIVFVSVIMFFLNLSKNKLSLRKPDIASFLENEVEDHLNAYTFSFENNILDIKTFGFKAKFTSVFLSLLLIVVPLYEFVETLRPIEIFYGFSCLP